MPMSMHSRSFSTRRPFPGGFPSLNALFVALLVISQSLPDVSASTSMWSSESRQRQILPGTLKSNQRTTVSKARLAFVSPRAHNSVSNSCITRHKKTFNYLDLGQTPFKHGNQQCHARSSFRRFTVTPIPHSALVLGAKKKGGGGGAPAGSKKIQVKLLKQVPGTGQKGEVIMVTPAFFQNKLRPTKSAQIISDDQVAEERAETAAKEQEIRDKAMALKEEMERITLTILRKAGPDGQLFGGIGPKGVMDEMLSMLDDEGKEFMASNKKTAKITGLTSDDGKKLRGDIKHTGEYGATMSLTKDIQAKFTISVQSE